MEIVEELRSIITEIGALRARLRQAKLPEHKLVQGCNMAVDGALANAGIQLNRMLEYVGPIEEAKNLAKPSQHPEVDNMPLIAIVMGSKSDAEAMQPTLDALKGLGIDYEVSVISAHRSPEKARQYGLTARSRGIEVIIAAAGGAAHLPGVLASWTTLPVIGVPLVSSELKGIDALYSIVQMPAGIPVASMAIGTAGAKNAAYLAAEILGLKYDKIRKAYEKYRNELQGESK